MKDEKLYVVRLYDGFDHLWMDVSKPLPKDEAHKILMEETKDGTKNTSYDDIDYYAIFPADTKMLYSAETRYGYGEGT
jgi:hypothetical protein